MILIELKPFMIKIYLPKLNYKFYNNIRILNDNNISIFSGDGIDIYKVHNNLKAHIYIFDGYIITNEITEFISEYYNSGIKFYIYHDSFYTINKDAIKYIKLAKHLLYTKEYQEFNKYSNTIQIPTNLINDHIFFNKQKFRNDFTAYFLDKDNEIPPPISNKLYPITKNKILLFNNNHIKHMQNLGLVSEYDKADILNEAGYFIPNKYHDYAIEAVACGCEVIDLNSNETLTEKYINQLNNKITYIDFLKSCIL